jgi:hypothetical protein
MSPSVKYKGFLCALQSWLTIIVNSGKDIYSKLFFNTMKYKLILLIFIFCCALISPTVIAAENDSYLPANLVLIPDYDNYFDPEFFYAYLYIQPNNQTINATEINLDFNSDVLSIADIDFTDSFCTLFIQNKIDNANGNLNVQCGRPNGASEDNIFLAKITFNKLQDDWSKLNLNGSQILLNDDFGTNILETTNIYNILIER